MARVLLHGLMFLDQDEANDSLLQAAEIHIRAPSREQFARSWSGESFPEVMPPMVGPPSSQTPSRPARLTSQREEALTCFRPHGD